MKDPLQPLFGAIREIFYPAEASGEKGLRFTGAATEPRKLAEEDELILRALVQEAVQNGLLLDDASKNELAIDWAKSGSTARAVVFARQPLRFAVKIQDEPKLVEEGRLLQTCQRRSDLPLRLRHSLPKVYAIKDDKPPYGYILEHFSAFQGLDQILFKNPIDRATAQRLVAAAMDLLFEAYDVTARRSSFLLIPDVTRLYIARIEQRVKEAATVSSELKTLLDKPITVNGTSHPPYVTLIQWLSDSSASLRERLAPPFATFVHGDAHPENILVRYDVNRVELKLIDPKEWGDGDYLFDVTKLTHYLEVTGPIEKGEGLTAFALTEGENGASIDYVINRPSWIELLIQDIHSRVNAFATGTDTADPSWRNRYQLAMASNLLGLPVGRLKAGKRESAVVMYAEGIKWLATFYGEMKR